MLYIEIILHHLKTAQPWDARLLKNGNTFHFYQKSKRRECKAIDPADVAKFQGDCQEA